VSDATSAASTTPDLRPARALIGVSRPDGYAPHERAELPGGSGPRRRASKRSPPDFREVLAGRAVAGASNLGLAQPYYEDWAALAPDGIDVADGVWKTSYRGTGKLLLEGSNEGYHPDFLHRIGRLANERNGVARFEGFAAPTPAGMDLGGGHSLMEYPASNATPQSALPWWSAWRSASGASVPAASCVARGACSCSRTSRCAGFRSA